MYLLIILLGQFVWANHGSVSAVNSEAWIIRADEDEQEEIERGMEVAEGDRIKTGKDSYVKVLMTDKNVLHIGPETEMELASYNSDKDGAKESVINVIYGRVRTALENKYDGTSSKFKVNTETAVLGVRGTDFVTVGAQDSSRTVVFEGNVGAQGVDSAGQPIGEQMVSQGQMTSVIKGQAPMPPVQVPLDMLNQLNLMSKSAQPFGQVLPSPKDMGSLGTGSLPSGSDGGGDDTPEKEDEKPEELPKEETAAATADDTDQGDDDSSDILVGVKYGTLGVSVEAAYPLTSDFHIKLEAYNSLNYTVSQGEGSESYDATLDFSGIGLLGQWGSSGVFQLIFGAYLGSNNLEVDGAPLGNEDVGGTDFVFAEGTSMSGKGSFGNSIAPYVGIGFNIGILGLFDIVGDIGAMSIGTLEVDSLSYTPRPAGLTDADIENEIAQIEEEASELKLYPIIRLGIGYSF